MRTNEEVDLLEGHHLAGRVAQVVPQPAVLVAAAGPLQPLVIPALRNPTAEQRLPQSVHGSTLSSL